MAVDTLNARVVMRSVRATVDRVPRRTESTARNEDVLEVPSRTISDEQMLRWIYQAEQAVAREAKGMYLKGLVKTHDGVLSNVPNGDILRPLPGWVFRETSGTYYSARNRTVAEHNYLSSSGRGAKKKTPAYTYDGGELEVYPQGSDPTILVFYISHPTRLTTSDVPSDPFYKSVASDELSVPPLFLGPILAFVTAKAERALENPAAQQLWSQMAGRFMDPYRRTFRVGRPVDYQERGARVDEPEVNVEV